MSEQSDRLEHRTPRHVSGLGYTVTWIVLLVLTGISFWVSLLDLGAFDALVALVIAAVKATLVVMIFMHLLEARFATRMVVVVSALFVVLIVGLTAGDVATRVVVDPVPAPDTLLR